MHGASVCTLCVVGGETESENIAESGRTWLTTLTFGHMVVIEADRVLFPDPGSPARTTMHGGMEELDW